MSDNFDYLNGEVGEPTSYTPIPKAKFQAVVGVAEMVDPIALGWKAPEDMAGQALDDYQRPFPRLRWKIEATESGQETEYAGRMVDQRLDLRSGVNPRTGRSFAEGRADLLRAVNGLKARDEVTGLKLIDVNLAGLDRDEAILAANQSLKKYEGTRAVVQVIHIKNKTSGEVRESVGKIVLEK